MVSVGMVGSPTEGDENRVQATASTRKQRLGRRSQSPIFEGVPGFCPLRYQCLNRSQISSLSSGLSERSTTIE